MSVYGGWGGGIGDSEGRNGAGRNFEAVRGSENIICVENNYLGDTYYRGSGAGEGPTASAVMADIMNISKDSYRPIFGIPENKMSISKSLSLDTDNSFYVRVTIKDAPGALSHITGIFAKNKIY